MSPAANSEQTARTGFGNSSAVEYGERLNLPRETTIPSPFPGMDPYLK
ncbi:MAG TPA: hypothetical protein VFI31_30300 [Pirellulales bacterium]|nr:hypothetical protein [Pirellulales bacterium]